MNTMNINIHLELNLYTCPIHIPQSTLHSILILIDETGHAYGTKQHINFTHMCKKRNNRMICFYQRRTDVHHVTVD